MHELRSRCQVEISDNGRLSKHYEARFQQSLDVIRDQYEGKFHASHDDIEVRYKQNMEDFEAEANRESVAASSAIEELRATRTRIDGFNSYLRELESTNAALNGRNCDLEKLLYSERTRHASEVVNLEAEFQRCRDAMTQQQLQESAVYDKLLCDEEDMSRTSREKDHIEITKSDPEVMVLKKGTKEVHFGGCQFKPNADDKENNVNFHRSDKIEGDVKKLIVSATYEPPINMVMKSQRWQSGDNIEMSLNNADGEEGNDARTALRICSLNLHSGSGSFSSSVAGSMSGSHEATGVC
ncbi:lamin-C-like [Musca autumnalis]|uniref:lamin-C-like n=1 Tax=Musca autumnalis TaxID=221902 RepID=UPI003CEF5C19